MKLVATNLIANGRLAEGVQLLCLIDKGLDACRYLQTYGAWDQAVWLAKVRNSFASLCSWDLWHDLAANLIYFSYRDKTQPRL
jgi:hypothetical protein